MNTHPEPCVPCTTQAAVDEALAAGAVPMVSIGTFEVGKGATIAAMNVASITAHDRATVTISGAAPLTCTTRLR